jgi:hypothetical protein
MPKKLFSVFVFSFLILITLCTSTIKAQAGQVVISPDPPTSEPYFTCTQRTGTFTVQGLDANFQYELRLYCADCGSYTGQTFYTHTFPVGLAFGSVDVDFFNPVSATCPDPFFQIFRTGHYDAMLYVAGTNTIVSQSNYFYVVENQCQITPNYPIDINQQGNILFHSVHTYNPFSVQMFPTNSCTYNLSITTDSNGDYTLAINCLFPGSHQISFVTADSAYPDQCWATINIGNPVFACISDSGASGLCYDTTSGLCRPPSTFDGQGDCQTGQGCCIPSNQTGFEGPCVGASGAAGNCSFLACIPSSDYVYDGYNPQNPTCVDNEWVNQLYVCCVNKDNYPTIERPELEARANPTTEEVCDFSYKLTHPNWLFDCTGINTAAGIVALTSTTLFSSFALRLGIGIAGGVAFLMMLLAGFQLMTSAGDPEKINSAKSLLVSAIGGLLLILFSVFILETIGVRILQLPSF